MQVIKYLNSSQSNINILINKFIKFIAFLGLTEDSKIYYARIKNERLWNKDDGEINIKYDFLFLNENSKIIDIGGYTGDFISEIFCRYGCNIEVYEPIFEFYNQLVKKFIYNKKINIVNCAIGAKKTDITLCVGGGATGQFSNSENKERVEICKQLDIFEVLSQSNTIDLLSINCEGAEYEILERIIEKSLNYNIKSFFIQFHNIDESSIKRKNIIIKSLSESHRLVFDYPWVWTRLDIKTD